MFRFFSPTLFERLFDPMPLPRRIRLVTVGKSRAPSNRVVMQSAPFAKITKKIPTYR
jgi:hypothetical protein